MRIENWELNISQIPTDLFGESLLQDNRPRLHLCPVLRSPVPKSDTHMGRSHLNCLKHEPVTNGETRAVGTFDKGVSY